eukprot:CAMPEP_0202872628 /NCGR_PEP_ID=MMETSP1391-20130828/21667_1 /ASSEMBLY_ACC=CAM_ASM_000867 /TAXON_ID=1034604 /ORGANISM="Chlamydomonas leiostraca, Strain SAG 11-49" /LENGTH=49 /DNA_ID=CAMNT_0049553723 /DNA_START=552 /DNA_END=701 /DNA_ORIENTATION=-
MKAGGACDGGGGMGMLLLTSAMSTRRIGELTAICCWYLTSSALGMSWEK